MVPLAVVPITMMPIMIGVGFMPMILGVAPMLVTPIVIMKREFHAGEVHSVISMPAVAIAIAGGIGGCGEAGAQQGSTYNGQEGGT